jgi:hypothetical protein
VKTNRTAQYLSRVIACVPRPQPSWDRDMLAPLITTVTCSPGTGLCAAASTGSLTTWLRMTPIVISTRIRMANDDLAGDAGIEGGTFSV